MSAAAAIVTEGLAKRFGEVTAVAGVSFRVDEGEIFAYLGRNGSGKTTTVRMLTTLTRPTAGTAAVAGVDISQTREVRRRIGVTLQEAALDPAMTAAEHLTLLAGLWGMTRRAAATRAHELLESFGLSDAANRKIATFSGGMLRRLDIASALVSQPLVLFLDEPSTGLDPQSRRALWAEIRRLRTDGVTVFLTTHYLEEADELADRLAVIDNGSIIAEGTPAELKATLGRTAITVEHAGTPEQLRDAFDGAGRGIDVHIEPLQPDRATVTLTSSADGPNVLAVLDLLRRKGPEVRHLNVAETSLEEVFLRLTGSSINAEPDSEIEPGAA